MSFNRPRKNVLPLGRYLEKINNCEIRSDQEVQRLAGQWNNTMINELIYTVLTDDWVPPIILAEEPLPNGAIETYILDGLQRSTNLMAFKYGNKKVTQKYLVEYTTRVDGELQVNEFNLKGKTYEDLPQELKNRFDDYQLDSVVHENCDTTRMNYLIARYNSSRSMSTGQRAFTYLGNFAKQIRAIVRTTHFFDDCGGYTGAELINGTTEKIISESYMTIFDMDAWKPNAIKMGQYINENATVERFDVIYDYYSRLAEIAYDKYADLFNAKNTCVMLAVFDEFTKFGLEDAKFGEFLDALEGDLASEVIGEVCWNDVNVKRNTKDKSTIIGKISFLKELMRNFFSIGEVDNESAIYIEETETDLLGFLQENVSEDITSEDVELFEKDLDDRVLDIPNGFESELMSKENYNSMVGIIAYYYKHEEVENFDDWFAKFFAENSAFEKNQKENLLNMISDLNDYSKAA